MGVVSLTSGVWNRRGGCDGDRAGHAVRCGNFVAPSLARQRGFSRGALRPVFRGSGEYAVTGYPEGFQGRFELTET